MYDVACFVGFQFESQFTDESGEFCAWRCAIHVETWWCYYGIHNKLHKCYKFIGSVCGRYFHNFVGVVHCVSKKSMWLHFCNNL